jgi:hypothetical protein
MNDSVYEFPEATITGEQIAALGKLLEQHPMYARDTVTIQVFRAPRGWHGNLVHALWTDASGGSGSGAPQSALINEYGEVLSHENHETLEAREAAEKG